MRLLILPGMDGSEALRAPFVAALGDGLRASVVAYPSDRVLDYAGLTDLASAALAPGEPHVVLGESFSGPIAIKLAARHPSEVRGLVLCASFVRNPRPGLTWLRPAAQLLSMHPRPNSLALRWLFGRDATHSRRLELAKALRQVHTEVLRVRLRAVLDADTSVAWRALGIPLEYWRARRDRLVPPSAMIHALRSQPSMRCVEFDTSHFILQAKPLAAAEAVREFCTMACASRGATA